MNQCSSDKDVNSNLERFLEAQADSYSQVLIELAGGQKYTHWMWYVFPQIAGLGRSDIARFYAIKSLAEAREYLNHSVLGARLQECTSLLLAIEGRSATEIFGYPDDLKLRSCMTLFASTVEMNRTSESVFAQVLHRFFDGQADIQTLKILNKLDD